MTVKEERKKLWVDSGRDAPGEVVVLVVHAPGREEGQASQ